MSTASRLRRLAKIEANDPARKRELAERERLRWRSYAEARLVVHNDAETIAMCARYGLPLPVDLRNETEAEWEAIAIAQQQELARNVLALTQQYLPNGQ